MIPAILHIAVDGKDGHAGSEAQPLASLGAARDRLRDLRRAGRLPANGAVVTLHAGTYRLDQTFALEAADSGTAEAPVTFRAAPGEAVTLTGGLALPPPTLTPVADARILARLPEAAREHVRMIDLAALGIAVPSVPCAPELTFRGVPMTLARWPNNGYARLAGPPEVFHPDGTSRPATSADGFRYDGDRPRGWHTPNDAWVHVWGNSWYTDRLRIDHIDRDRRQITTDPPNGSRYGYPKGGRYFCFNILEELDEPGEYYLDRAGGRLYLWPPAPACDGDLWLSLLEAPLVALNGVTHVRFEDLALRQGRGDGLVVRGGADVAVTGCLVSDFGGSGIVVEGGRRHAVRGCEVRHVGHSGIALSGGDRLTLERAEHVAEGNHVHHFALWTYCYQPGVLVGGGCYESLLGSVGIRIAHNRIHDGPHNGILYWGNDLEIAYNDIYRVVMESTDAGAIYTGRDFARRGSVIRHNYIHHNGAGGPFGTMGVYLDDCAGGEQIVGNILQGLKQAVYMGGGTDTVCENNLFIDCDPAVHLDMRGMGDQGIVKDRFYEVKAHQPPYVDRYPELVKIHAHYEKAEGIPPDGTRLCRNIAAGDGELWSYASSSVDRQCIAEEHNLVGVPASQIDPGRGGLIATLADREGAIGFERIPVEQIGLVRDAAREIVPPVALLDYRLVVETPWAWRDNVTTNPVLRLEIRNLGATRETGVAEVFVSPAEDARIEGGSRLAFDLPPGASVRSVPLALGPDARATHMEVGVRRPDTVDPLSWHWLYLQHSVTAHRLGPLDTPAQAFAALEATAPLRTAAWDGSRGDVRMGLTDTALAITFDLLDSDLQPRLDDGWWLESCVELFGFGPGHPVTEQLGLVPAGEDSPARVLWFHDGIRQAEAPGALVACVRLANGYRMTALIPDRLLGWDRTRADPTLEMSINSRPDSNKPRERIRVFGVEIWQNERHRFARLCRDRTAALRGGVA
jgi:hypothetical protein